MTSFPAPPTMESLPVLKPGPPRLSSPAPPSMRSLPSPPSIASSPSPPNSRSAPLSPLISSFSAPPISVSAPGLPWMVAMDALADVDVRIHQQRRRAAGVGPETAGRAARGEVGRAHRVALVAKYPHGVGGTHREDVGRGQGERAALSAPEVDDLHVPHQVARQVGVANGDLQGVGSRAPVEAVTGAPYQHVVADATDQPVVAATAIQDVVAAAPVEPVVAVAASQRVGPGVALDHVGERVTGGVPGRAG